MLAALRITVVAGIAAALSGILGSFIGEAAGYGVAWVSGRDPRELKDMIIWCIIGTSLVSVTGAFWATLHVFNAARWARFFAAALVCLATAGSIGIVAIAYVEAPRFGPRSD